MPKKKFQEPEDPPKPFAGLAPKVQDEVMAKVGKPPGFINCIAAPLFDNRFRVNIWGNGENGQQIVDSYFVHATEEDGIISSSPEIKQKYSVPKAKPAPPISDDEIVVAE